MPPDHTPPTFIRQSLRHWPFAVALLMLLASSQSALHWLYGIPTPSDWASDWGQSYLQAAGLFGMTSFAADESWLA